MDSPDGKAFNLDLVLRTDLIRKKDFLTCHFLNSFMDSPDGKAFNLDLVILACFANEPISMMAATFQSDINHQSQVAHQSSI